MKKNNYINYRCPYSLDRLSLEVQVEKNNEVIRGKLINTSGEEFLIDNGVPDFTWPKSLAESDLEMKATYEKLAEEYEKFADFPFRTFGESQDELRQKMTNLLCIKPGDTVLEVGCGDGRGSEVIARTLGSRGMIYMQELSGAFLNKAIQRVGGIDCQKEYSIANASYLSFGDNYFDAAHHFGGLNTFAELKRFLTEMVRVVKPGGKVVIGDESMAPWLRETEFGKVMMNSNPLLKFEIPFEIFPVEVRDLSVEWVCKGAFFVIQFEVGEGEPTADYHIPIPSERGGSHWTRYYGNLEGVSDKVKRAAYEAQKSSGMSMHDWLNKVVEDAAKKELEK